MNACELQPTTITTRSASDQAEDIGVMLIESSPLRVVINTTGVPKYRIEGLMITVSGKCLMSMPAVWWPPSGDASPDNEAFRSHDG